MEKCLLNYYSAESNLSKVVILTGKQINAIFAMRNEIYKKNTSLTSMNESNNSSRFIP